MNMDWREGRKSLSMNERRKRLEELEDVIERHLVGFVEVGKALTEIRDAKLYLETHSKFEKCVGARFSISRRRAYELMAATTVRENLVRRGAQLLPANERQTRELARLESEEQAAVWSQAVELAGEDELTERIVKRAIREHNRKRRVEQLRQISAGNPQLDMVGARFPIIEADPPWQYDDGTTDPTRQIENHYPTMTLEEIKALDVDSIATPDCVLFMWAVAPMLPEALEVIDAWGFKYKTGAVWDKMLMGPGYWFRGQHEHLLLAVRGNPPKPPDGVKIRSIIVARRQEHSSKPAYVKDVIDQYYPELPKLELFARETEREGWHTWGNQSEVSE